MSEYLEWYYLMYEIPLLLTLVFGASLAFVDVGHHDADLHPDAGHALHAGDSDHPVDIHRDGPSHDTDGDALRGALMLFGYGKLPIPLVIAELCLCWGASGLIVNRIVTDTLGLSPALVALPSIAVATVTTLGGAILLAKLLVWCWPTNQNFGVDLQDLTGSIAVVTQPVSDHYGAASLRDRYDTQHTVYCRGRASQLTLPTGTQVLLVEFDEKKRMFIVESLTDDDLR